MASLVFVFLTKRYQMTEYLHLFVFTVIKEFGLAKAATTNHCNNQCPSVAFHDLLTTSSVAKGRKNIMQIYIKKTTTKLSF